MRKKLIIIFMIIGCIPLLAVSGYFYSQVYNKTIREATLESEQDLTASKVLIQNVVQDRMLMVKVLAQDPVIKAMNAAGAKAVLTNMQTAYPDVMLVLEDGNGKPIARGDQVSLNYSVADRQFFKEAMTGKTAISDVLLSKTSGQPILVLAVPIENGADIAGVLQISFELKDLGTYVKKASSDNTVVSIVDREGKLLAHPDSDLAQKRVDLSNVSYIQQALQGKSGEAANRNAQGVETIVHYTQDKLTGWVVCSETPKSVIMSGLNKMTVWIAGGVIIVILLIFAAGYIFSAKITKPVVLLAACFGKIAMGDLSVKQLQYTAGDEIGDLGRAFNAMIANLRTLVSQVFSSAEQVAASSEELTANVEQSAQATNQVAASITDTAQGAEKQVRLVDKSLTHVERIATEAKNEADRTQNVVRMANLAVEAANEGNKAVDTAVNQMNNIRDTVENSAKVVAELGENSNKIGQIVETISAIAGQTNLLALNAAIEAARAGEQGRGFAVVAEEVRKLAEQSEESAKQIASLIGDIRGKTEAAVTAMSNGMHEVKRGSEVVDNAGKAFYTIDGHVKQVASIAEEMAESMSALSASSHNVLDGIQETERISREISSQSQTVSAATQEQSASMEEIASASQNLAQLAEQLRKTVSQFKV